MSLKEAMLLMYLIEKRQLPGIEATLIDMGDTHVIRLDRHEASSDQCCVWYIMCPRDWALIALEEAKAR
jgi:hypothetical protein